MDYSRYTQSVGHNHAAFQRLELRLRVYLETLHRRQFISDYMFYKWNAGDFVAENELTNRQYFSQLLTRYNKVAPSGMDIDTKLAEDRNIIVHGRLFEDPKKTGVLRLINFGAGPKGSKTVKVLELLEINDHYLGDLLIRTNRAINTAFAVTVDLEMRFGGP